MFEDYRKVWNSKLGALPRIPRGNDGYLSSLQEIIRLVSIGAQPGDQANIKGSTSKRTLEQCCIAIRPYGLVERQPNRTWIIPSTDALPKLSDNSEQWFRYLAAHTKFFGEMLAETKSPKSALELLSIANGQFYLSWKGNTQINTRLNWLMDIGLIEVVNHFEYKITSKGSSYLNGIVLIDPKYAKPVEDVTLNVKFTRFNESVEEQLPTEESQLNNRKNALGYFLGGNDSLLTNTIAVLSVVTNESTLKDIANYSTEAFGVKESSVNSFVTLLASTQLVEYVGPNRISLTKLGQVVANGIGWLDLFGIFHSHYKFMGEILSVVKDDPKSCKQISQIGRVSFGIGSMPMPEIQKRCAILRNAQLIRPIGKKFVISALGNKVLEAIVISKTIDEKASSHSNGNCTRINSSSIIDLITEIEDASRDSANSVHFEKVLAKAFVRLGFDATWIGGSGDTDVLVSTQTAAKYTYTFNVDSKATYSGPVGDAMVNFDALEQHRKKHNSDYVIVVGAEFSATRIITWAKEHRVGLMATPTLIDILKKHERLPLTADQYRKVFEQVGIINADVLNESRRVMQLNAGLMNILVKLLISESRDSVSGGLLTPKELYFLIRATQSSLSKSIMDLHDPVSVITSALDFLSTPFINVVGRNNDGYFVKGSRADAAQKFQFYAGFLQE